MVSQQTPAELIWRDDDISCTTLIGQLEETDAALAEYGLTHTIAVIACDLHRRPDLVEMIKACRMDVQLHCWTHEDMTLNRESLHSLSQGVEMIERLFGARPTVLYPPWNRADETVVAVAAELGLRVSVEKVSLQAFIRVDGDISEPVVNFHYWSETERSLLRKAARIHHRRRQ